MRKPNKSSPVDRDYFFEQIREDIRPWGKFRAFPHSSASSIKIITVNPGSSLSLQYHDHRSEFWIVLDAGLEVTVGNRVWEPDPNEEIFIPTKTIHRLRSIGRYSSRVMELWLGESEESDIVRIQDNYGRANKRG